ncbi:SIMPL domain-containing protein [Aldersonia kunmingensis]|uniref:SIMPL domain-containing protein n=1 Tax=Aldersonia kunmingensis TaxID=408066 RepID=UPI0008339FE4|nr:SIMPL domain-containing protein [Aldersonia kunmingensis]
MRRVSSAADSKRHTITRSALVAFAALTLGAGTVACSSSNDNPREVTVVGTGEVRGAPDILNADVGVEVIAPDVSGAVSEANAHVQAIIDAVTAAGVAREDVRTTEVTLQPEYAMPGAGGGTRAVSGYRATNTVRITIRELGSASEILDDAVRAGGDAARLGNVSFAIEDDSQLLADARASAFNDAKTRAEQYADLADVSLGDVITINETSSGSPSPMPRASSADELSAIPLEPGTQTVTFNVTVSWALD